MQNTRVPELGCNWALAIVVFQSLGHVQLFVTPWTAARQAPLSFTISWSLLRSMSIKSVMPSNHPILCCSFVLWLQSFPASGSFPRSQLFASGGQNIGVSASASVLPVNIQGGFPLGLTGHCSPQDSQESSSAPQFESIDSLALSLPCGPTLTSVHDGRKSHSFDCMDLCQQKSVSAF